MEKYVEIERSIIKKFRKDIWSKFVKAVKEYELIKENDTRKQFFGKIIEIQTLLGGELGDVI